MQAFRLLLFRREFLDLQLGLGFEVGSLLLGLLHQLIPALLGGDPGQSPLRSRGFDEFRALFLRGGDEFLAGALRLGAEVFSLFGDLFRERLAAVSFCICSSTTFFTASSAASLIPRVIFGEENVPPMFTPTDWSVFPPGTATFAL